MRLGGGGPPGGGPPAGYRGNYQQNYARDYSREFGGENTVKTAGIVGAAVALFLLVWGVANVEVTEYALNYSLLTRKVEDRTYTSGRYWIGPFNYFIRFPAVVKTIQFSEGKMQFDLPTQERSSGLLRSRTSDGLDVNIELSFQYQLQPESLHNLYTTLGGAPDYHNLFVRVAIDRLTETATVYSATSFFVDRTKIGKAMEAQLRADFEERLFATIFSFQLRSVQLPQEFEDAIQETEVMKQDMQVAEAEQSSTKVALETELMKAKRRTRVRANKADASAQSTMLANSADIEQYTLTQHKAADSYAEVLKALDGKESDVLEYIESRVLRDHPSGLVTVGLGLSAAKGKDAL